jgi:type 1 glutamine amidotransferase
VQAAAAVEQEEQEEEQEQEKEEEEEATATISRQNNAYAVHNTFDAALILPSHPSHPLRQPPRPDHEHIETPRL